MAGVEVPVGGDRGTQTGLPGRALHGPARQRLRWWWPRAAQTPEDRRRILAALYPAPGDAGHWRFRYAVMLGLSVVIATMGLSLNSTAIVIGAMLVAPLMTPVLGMSAAIVMAWPSRLGSSAASVLIGSIGAVGLAFAITSLLPGAEKVLTAEVVSRTSPDLRDLIVALAAGAAGAYATARSDVSAALPGVAVAVALVPPLAVVGFALAIDRADLAEGALLLFAVNLMVIVLIGALVFLGSGFVPSGRFEGSPGAIRAGLVIVALTTAGLVVPLTFASLKSVSHFERTQSVNQAIVSWLAPYPQLKATGVSIQNDVVGVDVTGPVRPPSRASLDKALAGLLGGSTVAHVDWVKTSSPAT